MRAEEEIEARVADLRQRFTKQANPFKSLKVTRLQRKLVRAIRRGDGRRQQIHLRQKLARAQRVAFDREIAVLQEMVGT